MLFSNETVAAAINNQFEPAWESVRPVPRVTIDFGNGKVVRRTLHGNVATYVTSADGRVLDVLPGIYEPVTFVARLDEFVKLHHYVHGTTFVTPPRQELLRDIRETEGDLAVVGGSTAFLQPVLGLFDAEKLRDYHTRQAAALKAGEPRLEFGKDVRRIESILAVERSVKISLQPAKRIEARAAVARGRFPARNAVASVKNTADLPTWKALAEDTRTNETVRRQQIHEYLAGLDEPTTPDDMKKWLYREVLHADLEDPYLGLGKILFDSYPFAEEDED